jgi:hypothetical protein
VPTHGKPFLSLRVVLHPHQSKSSSPDYNQLRLQPSKILVCLEKHILMAIRQLESGKIKLWTSFLHEIEARLRVGLGLKQQSVKLWVET